jgi:cytidylate kinase
VSRPFLLTLDGPAGVGKSTTARALAASLGLACLDTGAMFRILALALGRNGDFPRGREMAEALAGFSFALRGTGAATILLCNGRPAGEEIRTEEAGAMASRLGLIPEVRSFLKTVQRNLGAVFPLVAEGRDMGTAIFPAAPCKLFLDARPEVRALRRQRQLREMGLEEEFDDLLRRIRERDEEDRNRPLAPLRPAPDAVLVDTSDLNPEEVLALCVRAARRAGRPG